ncbi:CAI-1 autoinducer synthase domain protein, partial [Vibrio parahaemolyticus VPTS-2010_2]
MPTGHGQKQEHHSIFCQCRHDSSTSGSRLIGFLG